MADDRRKKLLTDRTEAYDGLGDDAAPEGKLVKRAPYILRVTNEDDLWSVSQTSTDGRSIMRGAAFGDVVTELWRDMVEQIGDVFPGSDLADRLRAIGELGPDKWGADDV